MRLQCTGSAAAPGTAAQQVTVYLPTALGSGMRSRQSHGTHVDTLGRLLQELQLYCRQCALAPLDHISDVFVELAYTSSYVMP